MGAIKKYEGLSFGTNIFIACKYNSLLIKDFLKVVSNTLFLSHFIRFRTVEYVFCY